VKTRYRSEVEKMADKKAVGCMSTWYTETPLKCSECKRKWGSKECAEYRRSRQSIPIVE